jgi:NADH:ubiquinone oxidoreductase subunit 3 (subunit A)
MVMHNYPYIWNYLPLILQILVALGLACGMVGVSFLVGKHKNSRTKLGPYECGMDPVGDARGRFSVRFYMVAMLFILFDVEAVFMLPWRSSSVAFPRSRDRRCSVSTRCWFTSALELWACSMSGRKASSTGPPIREIFNGPRSFWY